MFFIFILLISTLLHTTNDNRIYSELCITVFVPLYLYNTVYVVSVTFKELTGANTNGEKTSRTDLKFLLNLSAFV